MIDREHLLPIKTIKPSNGRRAWNPAHWAHPHLLRSLAIERANQVLALDITCIPTN